ncbi:MAG: hypothetical protein ABJZ69_17135 [Hyphomicrobiales bacterium]
MRVLIMLKAIGGWAGPGLLNFDEGILEFRIRTQSVGGEEAGTITLSGNFAKRDDTALGSSTVLLLYLHNENSESDFVRGQGELDIDSGNFTATITDIPVGYSKAVLSFVTLDPADAGADNQRYDTAFEVAVVNEGCSNQLRIRLEWETDNNLELWVVDPNGDRMSHCNEASVGLYMYKQCNGRGGSACLEVFWPVQLLQ